MNRAVVVLGAGASRDVVGFARREGRAWIPPLAKDLFVRPSGNPQIEEILGEYPGAVVARELILRKLSQIGAEDFDLEGELRRMYDDPKLHDVYKHVPPFLRDYLNQVSRHYATQPGAYIELAARLTLVADHEIAFIVLNYDTFLEDALGQLPARKTFGRIKDYPAGSLKVFKIHGSVNWFTPMGNIAAYSKDEWLNEVDAFDIRNPDLDIQVYDDDGYTHRLPNNNTYWYPILTAPMADKSAACPKWQIDELSEFLADADKFLVIGTSGKDLDLLQMLKRSNFQPKIAHYVVGSASEGTEVFQKFEAGAPNLQSAESNGGRTVFDGGFAGYLASPEFDDFLIHA